MKLKMRAEYLFYMGFSIVFLRQPLQYLIGPYFLAVLAFGMGLCFCVLAINARSLRLTKKDTLLTAFFFIIFILHGLLALNNSYRENFRPLWFFGLAQVLLTVLFLHYRKSPGTWKFLQIIFLVALVIECSLAFLQVSYYSTGIGLPPVFEEYELKSFVSGSFFNANDFSVYVVSSAIALCSNWMLAGKDNRAYLLIGLALLAVFVSLSRTAFVFMLLFTFTAISQIGKKLILAPMKKSNFLTLIVLVVTLIAVVYLLSASFLVNTSVFDRAIIRISQIGQAVTDESGYSRSLVYLRLSENLPNLWLGTFSDRNYSIFFKLGDLTLMKVNPHSFLAEMSFLYGWPGFVCALGLIVFIVTGVMINRDLPLAVRWIIVSSLVFFQSVPSSILGNINFFTPYLLLIYCRKNLLAPTRIN